MDIAEDFLLQLEHAERRERRPTERTQREVEKRTNNKKAIPSW